MFYINILDTPEIELASSVKVKQMVVATLAESGMNLSDDVIESIIDKVIPHSFLSLGLLCDFLWSLYFVCSEKLVCHHITLDCFRLSRKQILSMMGRLTRRSGDTLFCAIHPY